MVQVIRKKTPKTTKTSMSVATGGAKSGGEAGIQQGDSNENNTETHCTAISR